MGDIAPEKKVEDLNAATIKPKKESPKSEPPNIKVDQGNIGILTVHFLSNISKQLTDVNRKMSLLIKEAEIEDPAANG